MLTQREQFVASAAGASAGAALARHLAGLVGELEPELLGVYWPHRSEFNAVTALATNPALANLPLALPFARRSTAGMHYRAWNRQPPSLVDDCGIASCDGAPVLPDVVLVPCVGFTVTGFRLGYGGGYFDRWLASHPDVTAVGVAWSVGAIDDGAFDAQPHDIAMTLIVTERGVV